MYPFLATRRICRQPQWVSSSPRHTLSHARRLVRSWPWEAAQQRVLERRLSRRPWSRRHSALGKPRKHHCELVRTSPRKAHRPDCIAAAEEFGTAGKHLAARPWSDSCLVCFRSARVERSAAATNLDALHPLRHADFDERLGLRVEQTRPSGCLRRPAAPRSTRSRRSSSCPPWAPSGRRRRRS